MSPSHQIAPHAHPRGSSVPGGLLSAAGYGKSSARAAPRRQAPPARAGTARRAQSPAGQGRLFHVPSFSIGLILGATVVLATAYLPEYLSSQQPALPVAKTAPRATEPATPPLTFEFDTLLRSTPPPVVVERVASADADAPLIADGEPVEYLLQAASFRSRDDADRLRAELLLLDLPAATGEVTVGSGIWYRVTVGPFADQQTAQGAMTRLRDRNLTAILVKRKIPT